MEKRGGDRRTAPRHPLPKAGPCFWRSTFRINTAYLEREGVATIPWFPAGADVSPLDVFVNPYLKDKLKGREIDTVPKLKRECALARAPPNPLKT